MKWLLINFIFLSISFSSVSQLLMTSNAMASSPRLTIDCGCR